MRANERRGSGRRVRAAVFGALLAGAAGGFLAAVGFGAHADKVTAPTNAVAAVSPGEAVDTKPAPVKPGSSPRYTPVVAAVQAVAPAVVSITTEVPVSDPFGFFYRQGQSTTSRTEGSGVVIDPQGIVLTNAHVVQRASAIRATFADGNTYEADVLGITTDLDLAVLRLKGAPKDLKVAPAGSSADLMLGEPVIAIGNPFGLGQTVTTGVVSAVHRALETEERVYQDFIQTDASINPGNSGGALIDIEGRLIGINTAIRPDAQGIGFAIPSDRAVKIAKDLTMFGTVQIPWLGIDVNDVTVSDAGGQRTAVQIERVYPQGGAAEVGMQRGDLVLSVDGKPIYGRADLNAYLASFEPGSSVALETTHGSTRRTVKLATRKLAPEVVAESMGQVLGVRVADAPPAKNGQKGGAVVTQVISGGAFAQAGLKTGDVILAINGQTIANASDVERSIGEAKSGHYPSALLTIRRGNAKGQINLAI
jgi:serine protease Do